MDLPHTNIPDTSMSAIGSPSASAESDMEVFEDARETTADEMEYEDTVERNSVNHAGEVTAVPSVPSTQFRFLPINPPIMPNAPPSTNMVSLSNHSKKPQDAEWKKANDSYALGN